MYKQLTRIVFKSRQWYRRLQAPSQIQSYLKTHDIIKLHIGAGPNLLDGWLNTTLQPIKKGSIHLNAIQSYPLPDASVDYIFSEHMIEHLTFPQGQRMLTECFRVMKEGGRIRIATPDLKQIIRLYTHPDQADSSAYREWLLRSFMPNDLTNQQHPCFALNKMFYGWDNHIFIYDYDTLAYALEQSGFHNVRAYQPKQSDDPHLSNLEHHGEVLKNEAMNAYETLIVEAQR